MHLDNKLRKKSELIMRSFARLLLVLISINMLSVSFSEAAPACHLRDLFSDTIQNGMTAVQPSQARASVRPETKPKLNSKNYTELTDMRLKVMNARGEKTGSSLKEAVAKPEIQQILNAQHGPHQILLRAKLPPREGGGQLKLVTLDIGSGNRAYNHIELVALLHTNPELANSLGLIRVEGHEDVAWVPDMTTLNFRLNRMAKQYGFADAKWSYGEAQGVVSTLPYLHLLADGKFPFSSENDINLSIHDSMHAVAFTVMNMTPGGRKVLDVAKSRNQIILKIHERLSALSDSQYYASSFLDSYAKYLSPDSLERTMLLTIVMTGNFDYFSAHEARQQGHFFSPQNKTVTTKRIAELMKLFSYGQKTFEEVLNLIAPEGDENRAAIKTIFVEELAALKPIADADFEAAARQIIKFVPRAILTDPNTEAQILPNRFQYSAAGPETLSH